MKPFNLEEAKAGKPVCTRDGREARIICFDVKNELYPIAALIKSRRSSNECACIYTSDGYAYANGIRVPDDLMMKGEKQQGWIGIYRSKYADDNRIGGTSHLYSSKEEVETLFRNMGITDICEIKQIEWED